MPDFRTDAQRVADELREAILTGEFGPGERLPQRTIADRYKTTSIVAREAIRAVAAEGLVVVEPRYGAMVEEVTPERLRERYIVREALEGMAARLAAGNSTAADAEILRDLASRCDTELHADRLTRKEKAELHMQLHFHIARMARCGELRKLLETSHLHSVIVSNAFHIDWTEDHPGWHMTLVEPIIAGKPGRAESAMRKHVARGLEMELAALSAPAAGPLLAH